MEQTVQQLLEEQRKTNEYLKANAEKQDRILVYLEDKVFKDCTGKNPYEMLTREQAMEEFPIGNVNTALKVFKDPELPVQRYTKAHTVQRKELTNYLSKSHDYLSDE